MTKQEIIYHAEEAYLKLLFSNEIVNTSKQVQKAIELTEPSLDTLRETECAVTFANAVKLFYKRVQNAYKVITIYSK